VSALTKALLAFQKEAPTMYKSTEGQVGTRRYKYLGLEDAMGAIRPVLNKHGLVVSQRIGVEDGRRVLRTFLVHAEEDHDGFSSTVLLPDTDDMQVLGKQITYARRYSLIAMLGLVADEDDDGAAAQKAPAKAPAKSTSPDGEGPSPVQHARLAMLLKELEEKAPKAEGQEPYVADARRFIEAKFGKKSRTQLTVTEMQDLIDEVERWAEMAKVPFG
jgi:hypothetical protein